jgi:hypothetical protein
VTLPSVVVHHPAQEALATGLCGVAGLGGVARFATNLARRVLALDQFAVVAGIQGRDRRGIDGRMLQTCFNFDLSDPLQLEEFFDQADGIRCHHGQYRRWCFLCRWPNGVVPLAVELVPHQRHRRQLLVAHLDPQG